MTTNTYICPICGKEHNSIENLSDNAWQAITEHFEIEELANGSIHNTACLNCIQQFNDENEKLTWSYENLYHCEHCGDWFTTDEVNETGDGYTLCEDCYNDNTFYCEHCEQSFYSEDYHITEDDVYLCDSCFENHTYICEDCGIAYYNLDNSNLHYNENDSCYYCEACYFNHEKNADEILNDYRYKPNWHFFKSEQETSDKPLYFGIEIEVHNNSNDEQYDNANYLQNEENRRDERHFIFKEDRSLDEGIEIVSMPHTLKAWRDEIETLDRYLQEIESNGAYVDNGAGLHIHITKRGMSDTHKIRLHNFVYHCKDKIIEIAQRENKGYANYLQANIQTLLDYGCPNGETRYQAVNWENSSTVELRVFKSSFNVNYILACIEFYHALYTFTKSQISIASIENKPCLAWVKFCLFVNENKNIYSHFASHYAKLLEEI